MTNSVRFYPADFLAAVQPFPAAAAGAYIRALCYYWQGASVGLPDDREALRRLCGCAETEWATVRPVVFGKLFVKDSSGRWQHDGAGQSSRL
jgi:uncharacterized protein YdaU (DUF1376 family)